MLDTRFRTGRQKTGGRTKGVKTQVKDFIKEYPYAVETLMVTLYELGIKGDIEAAKYVIDRIKGKPKANIGIDPEDKNILSASLYLEFCKLQDTHLTLDTSHDIIEGEVREY